MNNKIPSGLFSLHRNLHGKENRFCHIAKKSICRGIALLLAASLTGMPLIAAARVVDEAIYREDGLEDYAAEVRKREKEPVQTNNIPSWPKGPAIGAAGAVVMDADSGEVLYAKNMEKHLYPASITKLMTALLAYENLKPSDTVTFSENAVYGIEQGSSNIGMDVGEEITVEQALYGLMVASANEVAIALGERVSGSEEDFAALMNERARQLGCRNTNFVTLNGLHDPDHYTCAYDMALIAREMFKYPELINYMAQYNYHFVASEKQPDDFWIANTNDFLTGEINYDGVIGGKTGYTDEARETLVTFAQRDDVRLVCVIMKEEPPHEYYDTINLLNYAFDNFKKVNISDEEDQYTLKSPDFLSFGADIFGKSLPAYRISENASLMIPNDASFRDLTSEIIPFSYAASGSGADQEDQKEQDQPDPAQEPSQKGTDSEDAAAASTAQEAAAAASPEKTDKEESSGKDPSTVSTAAAAVPAPDVPKIHIPDPGTEGSGQKLEDGSRIIGVVTYRFHDYDLASADILFLPVQKKMTAKAADSTADEENAGSGATSAEVRVDLPEGSSLSAGYQAFPEEVHGYRSFFFSLAHIGTHGSVYLNILLLLPLLMAAAFLLCIFFFIHSFFSGLKKQRRRKRIRAERTLQSPPSSSRSGKGSGNRRNNNTGSPSGSSRNRQQNARNDRAGNPPNGRKRPPRA